jgi:hypothetical protein
MKHHHHHHHHNNNNKEKERIGEFIESNMPAFMPMALSVSRERSSLENI